METSLPPEFGKEILLISPQEAYDIVLKRTRPLGTEVIRWSQAPGRCLACDVRSDRDLPPTDRSAMDGFAFCARDISHSDSKLTLTGEAAAGDSSVPKVTTGACVSIFTGAVVPPGADTVVKVEDTETVNGVVTIHKSPKKGSNIRRRGEETIKGTVVLTRGTVLGPGQVGLCASVGRAELKVYCRPRVAIISTGTEIAAPEDSVKPWQIRDSNGPTLCAALDAAGTGKLLYRVVRDNATSLRRSLRQALKNRDLVLLSGGVSVGRYDLVPQILEEIGACIRFHKVAIKPGKPVLYATVGRNQHIFGLPGHPLSAMTGFHEFVLPALRRLSGWDKQDCRTALFLPLAETLTPKGDRQQHVLVKVTCEGGASQLEPISSHGSADLVASIQAHGVALLPRDPEKCRAGCFVEFRPWRTLS